MRGLVASFHARINIGAPQFDIEKINPYVNFSLSPPPLSHSINPVFSLWHKGLLLIHWVLVFALFADVAV